MPAWEEEFLDAPCGTVWLRRAGAVVLLIFALALGRAPSADARDPRGTAARMQLEFHVSPAGSDSADGSAAHPWRTIQNAADRVVPGAVVHVAPGRYESGMIDARVSGTPTARIRFLSDSTAGNATSGEHVFTSNCIGCHRIGDRGGNLGPDLSRIGAARARAAMARQIRGTMGSFRTGYEPVTLTTPNGQEIQGVKKNEDQFSVQVMDTRERIQGYLREDMQSVSNEKKSAMPVFGPDRLSDADLDDLLAYLESLQGTSPAPSNAR